MVSANYSKITKIYIILMTVVLVLTMTVWTILSKTLAAKVFKGYNLTWFVKKKSRFNFIWYTFAYYLTFFIISYSFVFVLFIWHLFCIYFILNIFFSNTWTFIFLYLYLFILTGMQTILYS